MLQNHYTGENGLVASAGKSDVNASNHRLIVELLLRFHKTVFLEEWTCSSRQKGQVAFTSKVDRFNVRQAVKTLWCQMVSTSGLSSFNLGSGLERRDPLKT